MALQTACLQMSSFACGMASIAGNLRDTWGVQLALLATALLGLSFLWLEGGEFAWPLAKGSGPDRSAFQSAFFALVELHGLQLTIALLWLTTMMAQVWTKGFGPQIMHRLMCFALVWPALDIIWVSIFTKVYLLETSL